MPTKVATPPDDLKEALKPVKVPEAFFVIQDGRAEVLKEVPPGSRQVRIPDRKWAIIVSDQQSGENRARVITAKNRTELVRRTKQEARRLRDPRWQMTGGELRAVDSAGRELFLLVTSWIWSGPIRESAFQEGVYFTATQGKIIKEVQEHLGGNTALTKETLDQFLAIEPAQREEDPDPEDDLEAPSRAMEAVARGYALEGTPQAESIEASWRELGLSFLAVQEEFLVAALLEASDRGDYLQRLGERVIGHWPGFQTFDRLLSEDRVLIEAEEGFLVRVSSGDAVDLRPSWGKILESEADDHTGLQVDAQDLCAVGSSGEDIPGDLRGPVESQVLDLRGKTPGEAGESLHSLASPGDPGTTRSPSEERSILRKKRDQQEQGSLFV